MPPISFKFAETAGLEPSEIAQQATALNEYATYLRQIVVSRNMEAPEASINVPSDLGTINTVRTMVKSLRGDNLKVVIVVGIGGSDLGTKAIVNAVLGEQSLRPYTFPRIIFADTVSDRMLKSIQSLIEHDVHEKDGFVLNVITKSGITTETLANFELLYKWLSDKFGDIHERVVITTTENSLLWNESANRNIATLPIPEKVGGRYSTFTPVGLFPLALAGIDIEQLCQGAAKMRTRCLQIDVLGNPALASALVIYRHVSSGIRIHNSFFFNPELESLGKWYRQLMGESLGKEVDVTGSVVMAGITPIVSIGSADLHSMTQLYLGGPRDKMTSFIYAHRVDKPLSVPSTLLIPDLIRGIEGKTIAEIMESILSGVKKAYFKRKIPYVEIDLPDTSEGTIGQFMQFKMLEIMYLAKLMGVNAFDQPNVQEYKEETRRLLDPGRSPLEI